MKRGKRIRYSKEIVIFLIIIVFLLLFLQVKYVFSAGSGQKDEIRPPVGLPAPANGVYLVVPVYCNSDGLPEIRDRDIGVDYGPYAFLPGDYYKFDDEAGVQKIDQEIYDGIKSLQGRNMDSYSESEKLGLQGHIQFVRGF